MQNCS